MAKQPAHIRRRRRARTLPPFPVLPPMSEEELARRARFEVEVRRVSAENRAIEEMLERDKARQP